MTELRRLLDEDCDELARAMLRAAADDEPPPGSLTALTAALGVAPGLTALSWLGSGSSTAAGSGAGGAAGAAGLGSALSTAVGAAGVTTTGSSLTALLVAKYVGIGMVSGLVAMGGMTLVRESPDDAAQKDTRSTGPAQPTQVRANGAVAERAISASVPASAPELQSPAVGVDAAEPRTKLLVSGASRARQVDESAKPVAAVAAPATTTSAAAFVDESAKPAQAVVEQNKGLTRELALLDRARSTLLAGNASQALDLLDQYRRVRVSMILDPEAEALRILALDRLGQHETASRLARDFIASHPASRQVDSLRVLAEKAQ